MFRCTPIPSYSTLACFTKGDPVAGRGRGEPPCVAQLSRIWVPWCPKAAEPRFKRISNDLDKLAMDGGILSTLKSLRVTLQTTVYFELFRLEPCCALFPARCKHLSGRSWSKRSRGLPWWTLKETDRAEGRKGWAKNGNTSFMQRGSLQETVALEYDELLVG